MKYLLCTIVAVLSIGSAAPAAAKPRVSHHRIVCFYYQAATPTTCTIVTDPRSRNPEGPFHF